MATVDSTAKLERSNKASPLKCFPLLLQCLLGESQEYPTKSHNAVISALMEEASQRPVEFITVIRKNRDSFLRFLCQALSAKDAAEDALPYVGLVTYAYRLVRMLVVLLSKGNITGSLIGDDNNSVEPSTNSNGRIRSTSSHNSAKLSAAILSTLSSIHSSPNRPTSTPLRTPVTPIPVTSGLVDCAREEDQVELFELSQPIFELLAFLIGETTRSQLLIVDGYPNRKKLQQRHGYTLSGVPSIKPILTGCETTINASRYSIGIQRTLLIYELLNFLPNEQTLHRWLITPCFENHIQASSNTSARPSERVRRSKLPKERMTEVGMKSIIISFAADSDDDDSDDDSDFEDKPTTPTTPLPSIPITAIDPTSLPASPLENNSAKSATETVRAVLFRYYSILSAIAHSNDGADNNTSEKNSDIVFPTIIRQRSLKYLREFVLMPCLSEHFANSRFHANDIMDLAFSCPDYSMLQVFMTMGHANASGVPGQHEKSDNEATAFIDYALPTVVHHFPKCMSLFRSLITQYQQCLATGKQLKTIPSALVQAASTVSKLLPMMFTSSNKRGYLLGEHIKELIEAWLVSLSIPFTNQEMDRSYEYSKDSNPLSIFKSAASAAEESQLLLVIDEIKHCVDRLLLLVAMTSPKAFIEPSLDMMIQQVIPNHREHPQFVLQLLEVISRSCDGSILATTASKDSTQSVANQLLTQWLALLEHYRVEYMRKSGAKSWIMSLIMLGLRSIMYLIPAGSSSILTLCSQKLSDLQQIPNVPARTAQLISYIQSLILLSINASNRLQSMLLRQGQSKIQQCKISLSNCLSVKEANEVLDKDNNISVSQYLAMVEVQLPQPLCFPLPCKIRFPGSWDHIVLSFAVQASSVPFGGGVNEIDIVVEVNSDRWLEWFKLIHLLILSRRVTTVVLIDTTVTVPTNTRDRTQLIAQLYRLLVMSNRSLEKTSVSIESEMVRQIYMKLFLEIDELFYIREDMRKSGVFAMLYFDGGLANSASHGHGAGSVGCWKLITELDEITDCVTGDHGVSSDMMFLMPRLTTTFDAMCLPDMRPSGVGPIMTAPSQRKANLPYNQIDWNKLERRRARAGKGEIPMIVTFPNKEHPLVASMIERLPMWREAVSHSYESLESQVTKVPTNNVPILGAHSMTADMPKSSMIQLCRVTGYITKQGRIVPSWRNRYFVLEKRLLRYYKDKKSFETGDSPLGEYMISIEDTECVRAGKLGLKITNYSHKTNRKTLSLRFNNEQELSVWKEGIEDHARIQTF